MAGGHGGSRPGAGAPHGGVSQLRRLLSDALTAGCELAGRQSGLDGDGLQVARTVAARIVSDEILAGRGMDVLKLMAVTATKDDGKGGDDNESPVLKALRKLPGMVEGRAVSTIDGESREIPSESGISAPSTSDYLSVAAGQGGISDHQAQPGRPFFAPQIPLLPAELAPSMDRAPHAGAARRAAPHPPAPGTPASLYPATAPLENFGVAR